MARFRERPDKPSRDGGVCVWGAGGEGKAKPQRDGAGFVRCIRDGIGGVETVRRPRPLY